MPSRPADNHIAPNGHHMVFHHKRVAAHNAGECSGYTKESADFLLLKGKDGTAPVSQCSRVKITKATDYRGHVHQAERIGSLMAVSQERAQTLVDAGQAEFAFNVMLTEEKSASKPNHPGWIAGSTIALGQTEAIALVSAGKATFVGIPPEGFDKPAAKSSQRQ